MLKRVLLITALLTGLALQTAAANPKLDETFEFSPMSPMMNIYGVYYTKHFTEKDVWMAGAAYMRIPYDFGHTNAPALIGGYRRYLWKNLHVEYQLWPTYDWFYESNEDKVYESFDIWNEFRVGYHFDFKVAELPMFVNVQWPLGFGLYASNKPESFKENEKEERFFYFPPMVFLGIRF